MSEFCIRQQHHHIAWVEEAYAKIFAYASPPSDLGREREGFFSVFKKKLKISFNSFRSNFRVNQFFSNFFLLSKLKNLERLAFVVVVVVGWLTTTTRKEMKKKFLWMNVAETKKKSHDPIWLPFTIYDYWPLSTTGHIDHWSIFISLQNPYDEISVNTVTILEKKDFSFFLTSFTV